MKVIVPVVVSIAAILAGLYVYDNYIKASA